MTKDLQMKFNKTETHPQIFADPEIITKILDAQEGLRSTEFFIITVKEKHLKFSSNAENLSKLIKEKREKHSIK